ncbi:DUF5688 family protein [Hominifimenecus sp. rT4P-3]|uniref:DUF5688 family protein n=1 Tax=Hominifimenecus sp. rT4P-3 TaxID=3242979 RepID=UPI003DA626D3
MGYEELLHYFLDELRAAFSDTATVYLHQFPKNNGIPVDTICISSKEASAYPAIYFSDYWNRYQNGESRETLLENIIQTCQSAAIQCPWDFSRALTYSSAQPYLAPKLIHKKRNQELLKNVPYQTFLDLAIVSCLCFFSPGMPPASALIQNQHLDLWDITPETLQMDASQNLNSLLTPQLLPLDTLIYQIIREEISGLSKEDENPDTPALIRELCGDPSESPMYVLTNAHRYLGATGLLQENLLKQFAIQQSAGFFILPSSIHEVILIPETSGISPKELQNMLMEINTTTVSAEEWLSNEIYYYSVNQEKILFADEIKTKPW